MEEQNYDQQPEEKPELTVKPKKVKRKIALCAVIILLVFGGIYLLNEMKYESTDDAYVENIRKQMKQYLQGSDGIKIN